MFYRHIILRVFYPAFRNCILVLHTWNSQIQFIHVWERYSVAYIFSRHMLLRIFYLPLSLSSYGRILLTIYNICVIVICGLQILPLRASTCLLPTYLIRMIPTGNFHGHIVNTSHPLPFESTGVIVTHGPPNYIIINSSSLTPSFHWHRSSTAKLKLDPAPSALRTARCLSTISLAHVVLVCYPLCIRNFKKHRCELTSQIEPPLGQ